LVDSLATLFGNRFKTIGAIADVICGPFGTAITQDTYAEDGIPLLRITNITKQGFLDCTDMKYITEECANGLMRMKVSVGDIVISQRGTLGQCAVVDDTYPYYNISANLIAVKNIRGTNAEYVRNYLLSPVGIALLQRTQSGQVQGKITTLDIEEMPIPVISDPFKLNRIIEVAYDSYAAKLREADALLTGMDGVVLERLGVELPPIKSTLVYAVKLGDIRTSELFCSPTYPDYLRLIDALKDCRWYKGDLEQFVLVNPRTDNSTLSDDSIVSFVPMTAVGNRDNTVDYEERQYSEVKTGYTVFQRGDLLWAKITPCMQNGKSCLVTDLPMQIGFGSTEFHILRRNSEEVYMPYVWAMLANSTILKAAQAVFNGSAGQQRVSDSFLKKFPLPLPDVAIQEKIADSIFATLEKVYALKREAETEWMAAKARFEQKLLGGAK
jgi:type I restriction enzyme S subunit